MRTTAETLGQTAHLSPLLRKTRKLGLAAPRALLGLAARRGCRHYAPAELAPAEVVDPGRERLSDLELAVALMSGAQRYDPQLVRCAAQLLGAPGIEPAALARAAVMERCGPILRHIAESALRFDPDRREFWTRALAALPASSPIRPGLLPHPTRFIVQSGIANPRRPGARRAVWLRPAPEGN